MSWAVPILAILISVLIGYLSGYTKKKGENQAIHEDINKVVDQVRAVTSATKEIEAKISKEVWDRQRRWELKRDVLFELARRTGRLIQALMQQHAIYMVEKQNQAKGLPERAEKRVEVGNRWNDASGDFQGTLLVVSAACGLELIQVAQQFALFMVNLSSKITDGNPEAFIESAQEIATKSQALTLAIRKELEISLTR